MTKSTTVTTSASTTAEDAIINDDNDDDDNDDDVFKSMKNYLDELNKFDIKFMRIRLVNNVIFFTASCFYLAMDVVPYSGLDPTNEDDNLFENNELLSKWINTYSILYFVAASMFVLTGILDLYLVYLGRRRSPQDVQEQIIKRGEARKIIRKHKHQLSQRQSIDATMMGFIIAIPNNNNGDDSQQEEEENEAGGEVVGSPVVAAEHHNSSICDRLCHCFCSCLSSVEFISWALLIGGLFGVASSIFVLRNYMASNVLNAISVHLFFIQACAMIRARLCGSSNNSNEGDDDNDDDDTTDNDDDEGRMVCVSKWLLIVGDISFGVGAVIDVIMSYVYIFSEAYFEQAIMTLISGLLWLLSSIVYGIVTLWDYHILLQDIQSAKLSLSEEFTANMLPWPS